MRDSELANVQNQKFVSHLIFPLCPQVVDELVQRSAVSEAARNVPLNVENVVNVNHESLVTWETNFWFWTSASSESRTMLVLPRRRGICGNHADVDFRCKHDRGQGLSHTHLHSAPMTDKRKKSPLLLTALGEDRLLATTSTSDLSICTEKKAHEEEEEEDDDEEPDDLIIPEDDDEDEHDGGERRTADPIPGAPELSDMEIAKIIRPRSRSRTPPRSSHTGRGARCSVVHCTHSTHHQ